MAIVFTCECGRKLQVAEKLAGKKGKCPQCGAVLMIPMESEIVPEEPAGAAEETEKVPTEPCPHCQVSIPVGSVFCTKCGTDLRTGQKHGTRGEEGAGYDMLKLWPDVFTKAERAVGVVVDTPLNAENFVRALGLLAVGLLGFMFLWTLNASHGTIKMAPNLTRLIFFPGFFLAGFLVLVVDAVMVSLAGRHFGSTGTSLAKSVMALMMTNAVYGFVHLLLGLVLYFGSDIVPAKELLAQIGPWALLAWTIWLTMCVIHRAYDTSQGIAVMFGLGTAALKGFVIISAVWLMTPKK